MAMVEVRPDLSVPKTGAHRTSIFENTFVSSARRLLPRSGLPQLVAPRDGRDGLGGVALRRAPRLGGTRPPPRVSRRRRHPRRADAASGLFSTRRFAREPPAPTRPPGASLDAVARSPRRAATQHDSLRIFGRRRLRVSAGALARVLPPARDARRAPFRATAHPVGGGKTARVPRRGDRGVVDRRRRRLRARAAAGVFGALGGPAPGVLRHRGRARDAPVRRRDALRIRPPVARLRALRDGRRGGGDARRRRARRGVRRRRRARIQPGGCLVAAAANFKNHGGREHGFDRERVSRERLENADDER